MTIVKTNPKQQDAAFYANGDSEVVYDAGRFYVLVAGEMRIYYTAKDGTEHTISTAYDLKSVAGVTTDKQLAKASKDEETFSWANNPWFEICDETDDDVSIVVHEIDEAIALADKMAEFYGDSEEVMFFQGSVKFE